MGKYDIGSIWDRFNRSKILRMGESLEEVENRMQDLVAKGQLTPEQYSTLIQEVNGLISKGNIGLNDLSEEVLQFFNDVSPEFNLLSVPRDKSVDWKKTDFIITSINQFDENDNSNIYGKQFNKNGDIIDSEQSVITHKILARSGDTIRFTKDTFYNEFSGAYYDSSGNLLGVIEATENANGTVRSFKLPSISAIDHFKVHVTSGRINNFMVTVNAAYPSIYKPFKRSLDDGFRLNETQKNEVLQISEESIIPPERVTFLQTTKNVLNKNSEDISLNKIFTRLVVTDFDGGFISHKIRAKAGDTIRMTRDTSFNDNIGVYYDEDDNALDFIESTQNTNGTIRTATLPNNLNIDHIRVHGSLSKIDTLMVTVNTPLPSSYEPYNLTLSDGINLSESQKKEVLKIVGDGGATPENVKSNQLYNKIYSNNGDSIAAATQAGAGGGYAKMIADKNNMQLQNIAVGGGTITAETYTTGGSARHWVSRTINNMRSDADYVILEGGVNDASLEVPVGNISNGYTAVLDDTTFCGALESTFKKTLEKFPESKIGFIIPHRIFDETRFWSSDIYPNIIKICEKWGIPYLDLSILTPPLNFISNLKNQYTSNGDGWHPNEQGYRLFYNDKIEEWMNGL